MIYLALQILLWLVIALLLGILIGWLIWGRRSTTNDMNTLRQRIEKRENEVEQLRADLVRCKKDLEFYEKDENNDIAGYETTLPNAIPVARSRDKDDLEKISGIGPFLNNKLNSFGIYTYKQIAAFTPEVIRELGSTFGSFSRSH